MSRIDVAGAYLAEEVGGQVFVDTQVPFLLSEAGGSDDRRHLEADMSVSPSYSEAIALSCPLLVGVGAGTRWQTCLGSCEGRGQSSVAGELEHGEGQSGWEGI